ncbi:MAG: fatty acid desaturase, partial [Planctomycetes bacterium]|nr:fatty acid desaturase [Planctomycetota bacterium]
RAAIEYPPELLARIRSERRVAIGAHALFAAVVLATGGPWVLAKVWVLPVFVAFPPVFVLNRLGQHYDIDPEVPAKWGTLIAGSWFWDRIFLWSNYHLEHHYYPSVPAYHLPELQRRLAPFYSEVELAPRTYGGLLWDYLVRNRAPHTRWSAGTRGTCASPLRQSPPGHL